MIIVAPADPRDEDCAALLAQSHALMQSMFSADECHFLDLDALCAPNIRFFAATDGDKTVGTGAIAIKDGYAEVKSMFTAPEAFQRLLRQAVTAFATPSP